MGEDKKQSFLDSAKKSLEDVRNNLLALVEYQATWAILLKARHEALTKAGFSEEQAFEIIKARGMGV